MQETERLFYHSRGCKAIEKGGLISDRPPSGDEFHRQLIMLLVDCLLCRRDYDAVLTAELVRRVRVGRAVVNPRLAVYQVTELKFGFFR